MGSISCWFISLIDFRLVTSHGLISQNAPLISLFGKHVVMVPQGKIAKAQIANNLIFLGQGKNIHFKRFDCSLIIPPLMSKDFFLSLSNF